MRVWQNFAIFFLAVSLFSCSTDERSENPEMETTALTLKQELIVDYFKQTALGFDNSGGAPNITRKWFSDVRIFLLGDPSEESLNELVIAIAELNSFFPDNDFNVSIVDTEEESNAQFLFGSKEELLSIEPKLDEFLTESLLGIAYVRFDGSGLITSSIIFVDDEETDSRKQKRIIREELAHALGMGRHSTLYSSSVVHNGHPRRYPSTFSEFDIAVLKLLYHPEMEIGLTSAQVTPILEELVLEIVE